MREQLDEQLRSWQVQAARSKRASLDDAEQAQYQVDDKNGDDQAHNTRRPTQHGLSSSIWLRHRFRGQVDPTAWNTAPAHW